MRIISQNGRIDVPYEEVVISIAHEEIDESEDVEAYMQGAKSMIWLGNYKNFKEANYVVEKIRQAYQCDTKLFYMEKVGR